MSPVPGQPDDFTDAPAVEERDRLPPDHAAFLAVRRVGFAAMRRALATRRTPPL